MDIMLCKARVKPGKEGLAKEWIAFLLANQEEGEKTLKNEKEHLEIYFMQKEQEDTYLYFFVLAEDLEYASQVAQSSGSPLDAKHFEYMAACVDPENYSIMKPELVFGDMSVFS